MTNNIQGNSHQAISWFPNRNSTSQKGMAWWGEREKPATKNTLPSKTFIQIWWRNQKLSRQAKVKRIQQHQTSFTTDAKGTSEAENTRQGKALQKKKQNKKTKTNNWECGNRITHINNLSVNGLNAPTKRHRLAEWIQRQDPYICCLQETNFTPKDTNRLKMRGFKNIFHANGKQKMLE